MSAAWTRMPSNSPSLSTATCRLRPFSRFAASQPRGPPLSVVLTLWVSMNPGCNTSTTAGIRVVICAAMEEVTMAAMDEAVDWARGLDEVVERIAPRFRRIDPRRRVRAYLQGLLCPVERKNGWQLAEHAGDRTPDGVQDFLARMRWDADQVRDDALLHGSGMRAH